MLACFNDFELKCLVGVKVSVDFVDFSFLRMTRFVRHFIILPFSLGETVLPKYVTILLYDACYYKCEVGKYRCHTPTSLSSGVRLRVFGDV